MEKNIDSTEGTESRRRGSNKNGAEEDRGEGKVQVSPSPLEIKVLLAAHYSKPDKARGQQQTCRRN